MTERYKPKKYESPIKAIREMCVECYGGRENKEHRQLIASCPVSECALHEFRFGVNPYNRKTLTVEQRKQRADRFSVSLSAQDSWQNPP
jgi:hypothetical protein